MERLKRFHRLSQQGPEFVGQQNGGLVHFAPPIRWEQMEFWFTVKNNEKATLALPLTYSGLERIYRHDKSSVTGLRSYRTLEDTRIRVDLPPGQCGLQVRMPALLNFFR
jgi:hypothetical protein